MGALTSCHTSNGIIPSTHSVLGSVGAQFRRKTAVVTVSAQNQPGSSFAFIMLLATPMTVWLHHSITLFC